MIRNTSTSSDGLKFGIINPTQYSLLEVYVAGYMILFPFFVLSLESWWLNLFKASDTVLHCILVSKLERQGFDGGSTQWIRYWLEVTCKELQPMTLCPGRDQRVLSLPRDWYWELSLFNIFASIKDSRIEFTVSKFYNFAKKCGVADTLEG